MSGLHLAWCSLSAARFAVHAWHYSHSLPTGKMVRVGVWEHGLFVGAVIFSRGNTPSIGRPFALSQAEICELTRVALAPHETPTSRIVAIALMFLKRQSPGLKAVVSYADPEHGHDGRGIYAAGNWLYLGMTASECLIHIRGQLRHPRSVGSLYGTRSVAWLRQYVDANAERIVRSPKHKYMFPFDTDLRAQLVPLVRPYPKRERSIDSDALGHQPREGGAHPTRSLSHQEVAHV